LGYKYTAVQDKEKQFNPYLAQNSILGGTGGVTKKQKAAGLLVTGL